MFWFQQDFDFTNGRGGQTVLPSFFQIKLYFFQCHFSPLFDAMGSCLANCSTHHTVGSFPQFIQDRVIRSISLGPVRFVPVVSVHGQGVSVGQGWTQSLFKALKKLFFGVHGHRSQFSSNFSMVLVGGDVFLMGTISVNVGRIIGFGGWIDERFGSVTGIWIWDGGPGTFGPVGGWGRGRSVSVGRLSGCTSFHVVRRVALQGGVVAQGTFKQKRVGACTSGVERVLERGKLGYAIYFLLITFRTEHLDPFFSICFFFHMFDICSLCYVVLHLYMLVRGPLSSLQQNLIEINTCSASELHVGRNFSLHVMYLYTQSGLTGTGAPYIHIHIWISCFDKSSCFHCMLKLVKQLIVRSVFTWLSTSSPATPIRI